MIDAIVPRPIALVSTINRAGQRNLAPFSFFNGVASNPPTLLFSVTRNRDGSKKHTLLNIEETGEFIVHSSNEWIADAVNQASGDYQAGIDEMKEVGLTSAPAVYVKANRAMESGLQFECKLHQLVPIGNEGPGSSTIVIGEILAMHIRSDLMENGRILIDRLKPIARLGGISYSKTLGVFDLPRPVVQKPPGTSTK